MAGERDLADALAGEDRRATVANILRLERETMDEGNSSRPSIVLDGSGNPITQAEIDETMARVWKKIVERVSLEDGA